MRKQFTVKAARNAQRTTRVSASSCQKKVKTVRSAEYIKSEDEIYEDIQEISQEFTSENTSINSSKLPAIFKMVTFQPGTINVDYGGGRFDNVADYLTQYDVINLVYDPYNRSAEHNKEVVSTIRKAGGADTATCSNVLNVIKEPEVRQNVLRNMSKLVKSGGNIYITVYEGSGKGDEGPTKSGYQLNRKTADYLEEIQQVFSDAKRKGKLIVATNGGAVTSSSKVAKRFKVTASSDERKITCRISNYKEFDNGHVMFNWSKMTLSQAEQEAKKASIKDPDNIYYVKFDNIMDPCSDTRWVAGKAYNYDQVNMRGDKPVTSSSKIESRTKVDPYQNENYKGYRLVLNNQYGFWDVLDKHRELEESGFMSKADAKEWVDEQVKIYQDPVQVYESTSIEASIDGDDYNQYWKDEFAPLVREEAYQMGINVDSEDADVSPKSIKHVFQCYFSKQDINKIQNTMRTLESRVKKAVEKTHWNQNIKLEYSVNRNMDQDMVRVTAYVTALAGTDDAVWSSTSINGATMSSLKAESQRVFDAMQDIGAMDLDLSNPFELNLIYFEDDTDVDAVLEKVKSLGYHNLMETPGDPSVWQYISSDDDFCLNVFLYGDNGIEVELSLENPEEADEDEDIDGATDIKAADGTLTLEAAHMMAEDNLNQSMFAVDHLIAKPSEKFPWDHFFINQFDVGMVAVYVDETGVLKVEDADTLELYSLSNSVAEFKDYLHQMNAGGQQRLDEAEGRYSANAATDIEGVEGRLPERPLDPPEYQEPEDVESSQETVQFNFDCDLLIGENGWDYADPSYDFAEGPGTHGSWYSESGVYLGDKTTMVEHLDELLMDKLPEDPGVYHISGVANLIFDVSGVRKYSDFQGMDEDNDPIIDDTFDTDAADADFNIGASSIDDFKCDFISKA